MTNTRNIVVRWPGKKAIACTFALLLIFVPFCVTEGLGEDADKRWYDNVSFHVSIENLSYETLKEEFKFEWEADLSNLNREVYEYDLTYSYEYDRDRDSYDKTVVVNEETEVEQTFSIPKIFGKIGYTSHLKYTCEKNNAEATERRNYDLAPLGIKLDLYNSKTIKELSLSYLPIYNYFLYYEIDKSFDPGVPSIDVKKRERALHNTIKLKLSAEFFDGVLRFDNTAYYKQIHPYDEIEENDESYKNYIFDNTAKLSYRINDYVSVAYTNEYNVDDRRRRVHGQPRIDHRNAIALTLGWN